MKVNLAVFGDIHGHQDLMYEHAITWEEANKKKIDAILQVGDFETLRNERDFEYYYAPSKYHRLSDFSGYYSGEKTAPFPTFFIAGNHEAWGHLKNFQEGSFIAPNIYFLGRAGAINFKGINIAGLSGIYNTKKYKVERTKEPSYDWKYYNERDVQVLINKPIDILLLHSWVKPVPYFTPIKKENVPCHLEFSAPSPTLEIIAKKKPKYTFMGHIHNSYLEAKLGDFMIFGLSKFDKNFNPNSFKVISYDVDK